MDSLAGKHALVCGSTQGIGLACAEELARRGAALTLLARDAAALERETGRIGAASGAKPSFLSADFREPEALRAKVAAHIANAGPCHILVNNTGGPTPGAVLDAAPDAFLEALRMHLLCNQLLVQTLVPGMKRDGYGRIINVISTSVREPIPNLGVSNTTRGAVASWAKTLAGELAPFGITVNNILPGYTDTGRLRSLIRAGAERRKISVAELTREYVSRIPLGRFARAEEIAAAAGFLASPAASYITGVSLPVDGGRIASI
ncbi:MAG: SDR family oxidoreductase [Planctomycetes bacterium]|nr:SDR family oxidoreductase [Planctomycetota bacterium]